MVNRIIQLLNKYNIPGPRYTSYPTVPAWSPEVGEAAFKKSLATLKAGESLSLYFHLPFCEKLCHFCGCMQVITTDHSRSRPYVEILLKELDRVARQLPGSKPEVNQIHFGGGTPNFLQPQELSDILSRIHQLFQVSPHAEVAIEMHPRTSTPEFCDILKELNFNRISLGIQDFDPTVQQLINRHQTYEMTEKMVHYLRDLGFDSFNFDLIYGLPGQNPGGWKKTLQQVLALRPNRMAVYSYAHVPWVRPVQRSFKDSDLPSPKDKFDFFEMAYETFLDNGYRPIGIDHFALEDDELSLAMDSGTLHRNFMGYSTRKEAHQIGFGVSAISYVGGNYFQNFKELPQYEATIQEKRLATFRGYLLNQDDSLRRDLITRIMCNGKVDLKAFEKLWNIKFDQYFSQDLTRLSPLQEDRLIEWDQDTLQATSDGRLFLRNIAMAFDPYLPKIQGQAKTPTFSKTV